MCKAGLDLSQSSVQELRKSQILEAAAHCFRKHGFHNAGMAGIAKAAGMSVGHIYHYYANKEAIIKAIIDCNLNETLACIDQMCAQDDVAQAMLDHVEESIASHINIKCVALDLEIAAESARNPKVAAMIQRVDVALRAKVHELFILGRKGRPPIDAAELEARVDLMVVLFHGLTCRGVHNPEFRTGAFTSLFREALRGLLD